MKFLIFNSLPFAEEISRLGHDVFQILGEGELSDILSMFRQEHSCLPDMILIFCMGNTALPHGLAYSPCPVVAYVMDSCLNEFWIKHYARLCQQVFVDQESSVKVLAQHGIKAQWLPLSVPAELFLPEVLEEEKEHDVVFVGRFHAHRVKRNNLISLLEEHFSIHVVGRGAECLSIEDMVTMFSKSKVVVNENLFDGLTLRVFQALASGSLLVTEESPSLHALFQSEKHGLTYTPDNVIEQIQYALSHKEQRKAMALAGQEACRQGHTHTVRAQEFLAALLPVQSYAPSLLEKRLQEALAHYALELRYPERCRMAFCCATVKELCDEPHSPVGARFAYALMCARGHMPSHIARNDSNELLLSEASAFIDNESFLLATAEPEGWRAALSWGYSLANGPEQTREKALPAFQLAVKRILSRFTKDQTLLQACQRLLTSAEKKEPSWALDMSMAHLYLALNICFETGFFKAKPESIPQCAAEFLVKVLEQRESMEAHFLLAHCYQQCQLPTEEAQQYLQMRSFLKDFPEMQSKIQESEHLLYIRPPKPLQE